MTSPKSFRNQQILEPPLIPDKLLLIFRSAEGRRLSWPEHTHSKLATCSRLLAVWNGQGRPIRLRIRISKIRMSAKPTQPARCYRCAGWHLLDGWWCCGWTCLKALMSLFVLASKDGWVNIMYTGLDAVGVDQQVSQLILLLVMHTRPPPAI